MLKILSEKLPRILKNKKQLQEKLGVKITNRGKEVFIDGTAEDEYTAEKVIEALNFGFPFSAALDIKLEDFILETLNIKDYTRRNDLHRVRARIIGKEGRALKTLSNLSESHIEIKDNNIGIIASAENLKNIQNSIILIIQGSKHGNVYKGWEKNKPQEIEDLGLKEVKK